MPQRQRPAWRRERAGSLLHRRTLEHIQLLRIRRLVRIAPPRRVNGRRRTLLRRTLPALTDMGCGCGQGKTADSAKLQWSAMLDPELPGTCEDAVPRGEVALRSHLSSRWRQAPEIP